MSQNMTEHFDSWPKSNIRTSFEQESRASGGCGNHEDTPVQMSASSHPLVSTTTDQYIWNLCFGWQDSTVEQATPQSAERIRVLREVDLNLDESFDDVLRDFKNGESNVTVGFLDVDCERRPVDPQDYLSRMLNFVSLDQESCYYSSISRKGGDPVMEIWYNACEKLSFDIDEQSSIPSARNVMLDRKPVPICFRYSFRTKKSIYILGNTPRATETILRRFCELAQERGEELHPFAFHLVILQDAIRSRDPNMAYNLKSLLLIEDLLLEGSLMTTQSLDKFRQQTQELHEMSRSMIITEHYNDRYLSNLRNLMRDMEGLENEGKRLSEGCEVNYDSHERTKDGLLCLLDYCMDRARRLNNRKQRVQNLIGLLYNLTANRDSMASLKIAEESTNIAHETRKDSMAMKTIATLTMLYLPASFVCSLFGTNFFALDTDGESQRSFVVSGLWWLLVVVAVPVTLVTFGVWLWWMKLQGNGRRKREDLKEKGNRQC